eukprot:CAMPEP_0175932392 /NCGR_PEP_ID=MMETSP0108-20121206/19368_1 /TAXON_ID=195067 ORGANISM="Goniomonas pacifica, Strain CCMP1869" /NCGR_SAMPLE_ID=MMETSP0108 /ASSEMBLY_ACC=CAM_ASM_000204 /LENGTH=38 /DNA_ID= /DNA_START= /DNA_END= /DNA_ORIENTATION=
MAPGPADDFLGEEPEGVLELGEGLPYRRQAPQMAKAPG